MTDTDTRTRRAEAQAIVDALNEHTASRIAQDADTLIPWIRRAIIDPGSIVGRRRSPWWPAHEEGYAEENETPAEWTARAVLAVLAVGGRPRCERCEQVIRVDDSYQPPLSGVGLWEHDGPCPAVYQTA